MRARGDGLVKNPTIVRWAETSLTIAGAAIRCSDHDIVHSMSNPTAVRRAVTVARLTSVEGLSPNAAEFALLETYLQLPERCPHCASKLKTTRAASSAN